MFVKRSPQWAVNELPTKDLAFKNVMRPSEFDTAGASAVKEDWDETRAAFFKVFTSLFLHYRKYLRFPESKAVLVERFDIAGFLKEHPSKSHPFLKALLRTRLFIDFIDDRIEPEKDDIDVMFFDESLDAKQRRSFLGKFVRKDTPFLASQEYAVQTTKVHSCRTPALSLSPLLPPSLLPPSS